MICPLDVATNSTVDFLTAHLPPRASVLEVGCGEGHVAWELSKRGFELTAIDSASEAVGQARKNGVPAIQASWPEFECQPMDAIAFTRSLHHIASLPEAVARAWLALQPQGVLLIEDFAFEALDTRTVKWFVEVLESEAGRKFVDRSDDEFIADLLRAKEPLGAWRENHDHDLHTIARMAEAIEQYFVVRNASTAPYIYRYLIAATPDSRESADFVSNVRAEEELLGAQNAIVLIGRRIVATPLPGEVVSRRAQSALRS